MSSPPSDIVFYDIAMRPPITETSASPNPWKARYALNFKRVPYSTNWVALPNVAKTRRSLDIPAGRKFADGTDFYTLPILTDATHNAKIGDSFDIAVYLQQNYPDAGDGDLFPPQALDYEYSPDQAIAIPLSDRREGPDDYARFNVNVDAVFTAHVVLFAGGLPLDPATAAEFMAESLRRTGKKSWDELKMSDEALAGLKTSFHDATGVLAKLFQRDTTGPFLLGKQASHADFIVGGWVRMAYMCMSGDEWEKFRGWHGGVFGKLYDALQENYGQVN